MVRVAGHGHAGPGHANDALHYAHRQLRGFQRWPLLDVQLQISGRWSRPVRFFTEVADPPQLILAAETIPVDTVVDVLAGELASEGAGGGVGWFKTGTLFVSPVDHFDSAASRDSGVVQGAHHLQRTEHTVRPVVLAALDDRIEVGAEEHRRTWLRTRAPSGHRAEVIHPYRQACLFHPAAQQVAGGAVLVGEREARHAPAGCRTDTGELGQAVMQAVSVDSHGESSLSMPGPDDTNAARRLAPATAGDRRLTPPPRHTNR
jgi:hypothetical protein